MIANESTVVIDNGNENDIMETDALLSAAIGGGNATELNDEDYAKVEAELQATSHGSATLEKVNGPTLDANNSLVWPKVNKSGNEWLDKAMKDRPRATLAEIHAAFEDPSVERMKDFWVAELGCGEDRCGGGFTYLVAMAFQQAGLDRLDQEQLPSFTETMWHFDSMIQYHSMNTAQLRHQYRL